MNEEESLNLNRKPSTLKTVNDIILRRRGE